MDVREKLVELLKGSKLCSKRFDDQYSDRTIAIIADYLIDNGVTVQEWISVAERLPGKEEYTATTEYGTEYYIRLLIAYKTDTVEYEIGYYDGYKWMTEEPIRLIKDVVAWMPFPNMPHLTKGE